MMWLRASTPLVMAYQMKAVCGSSRIVAERIRKLLQERVENAGIEILDARITYLAYAPEIAAVIFAAPTKHGHCGRRKMIVDGAVYCGNGLGEVERKQRCSTR